jgi:hypothetical protein
MRRIALIALLAGCGAAASEPEPDPGGPLEYRPCAPETRVGEFRIELVADPAPGFTSVGGQIAAGLVPGDVPELLQSAHDCRLFRRRRLFCDPPCGPAETCGADGRCIAYPVNQDVGAITVSGLAHDVRMRPTATSRYFYTSLPYPGFQPGASIQLRAEGGRLAPFTLRGAGVTPLVVAAELQTLEMGRAFEVTWTADSSPARIGVTINIDQHGTTPATLACDVADTGATSVPADLVTTLIASGTSGYPRLTISRHTADSTTLTPGCVQLTVEAAVARPLQITGHTPCMRDSDCPAGTSCNQTLQSCR